MSDATAAGGSGDPPGGPAAADLDEKVLTEAVRRGLITSIQGSAALDEARGRAEPLLKVLRAKGLVSEAAAKDLDEETREDFVPGYRVLSKLGEGGMGVVYKAVQKRLDRIVALKVVVPRLAADPNYLRRFEREAKAAAKLNHPAVVAAYDYGESNGRVFLAMEFVEGLNCGEWMRANGVMSEERALALARDVAAGLSHAHAAGIIHRDIKPGNILIADRKPGATAGAMSQSGAKVTDLGLARSGDTAASGATELTAAGAILGTPGYMSPEQAFGEPVDHRCDIYALGATLYQLVTGQRPFEATTPIAVIARQASDRLADPREYRRELSEGLVVLLQGMLSRQAITRYADYKELNRDIDRVRDGGMPARPLPPEDHRSIAPRTSTTGPLPATLALGDAPPQSAATVMHPGTPAPPIFAETMATGASSAPAVPASPPPKSRLPILLAGVAVIAVAVLAIAAFSGREQHGDGGHRDPTPGSASPREADNSPGAPAAPSPEALLAEAAAELERGDLIPGVTKLMALRRDLDGMSPADRARLGDRFPGAFRDTVVKARAAAEADVERMVDEGEYDRAKDRVQWYRDQMGDDAGEKMKAFLARLEGIGGRGKEQREAFRAALDARKSEDPLAALAALEGFEDRFDFAPPRVKKEAASVRAWAEAEAPPVEFRSAPPGAALEVDGKPLGKTPVTARVRAGERKVRLTLEKHRPMERAVSVPKGGGDLPEFRLEPERAPDPEPAVPLVPDGDPRPLWTGASLGAWTPAGGEWSVSDPTRKGWIEGAEQPEPASNLRGQGSALGRARYDVTRWVKDAPGWRLEWQMLGEGRRNGTVVRTEVHFAGRADGSVLAVGIDDQNCYLGVRDPATGRLDRTHALSGVEPGRRHTFVVEHHGDVVVASVDSRRIGAVKAPADLAPERTVHAAVEGGVGYFSDILLGRLKRP